MHAADRKNGIARDSTAAQERRRDLHLDCPVTGTAARISLLRYEPNPTGGNVEIDADGQGLRRKFHCVVAIVRFDSFKIVVAGTL